MKLNFLNKHPIIYWLPAYASLAIIAYFSLSPLTAPAVEFISKFDFNKLHILAYFIFSFFLGTALKHSKNKIFQKNHYSLAIFVTFFFGSSIELMQNFVPGRFSDFLDLMFNLSGIIFAQLVIFFLEKNKNLNKIV